MFYVCLKHSNNSVLCSQKIFRTGKKVLFYKKAACTGFKSLNPFLYFRQLEPSSTVISVLFYNLGSLNRVLYFIPILFYSFLFQAARTEFEPSYQSCYYLAASSILHTNPFLYFRQLEQSSILHTNPFLYFRQLEECTILHTNPVLYFRQLEQSSNRHISPVGTQDLRSVKTDADRHFR